MGALLNVSVRLRKFVSPAMAGTVAPALTFRSCTSRKFVWEPANDNAPPKLLAWESRRISVLAAVAVNEVVPITASAPDCESAPPVVKVRFPLTVEAARFSALASVRATLLPLVMPTVPKLFAALVSVMSFTAPAASMVIPATVRLPVCVKTPLVVTFKVPLTVEAARFSALASVRATLLPLVMPTVPKLFAALFKVMLLAAPAVRVVVPVTVRAPDCVRAPLVVTFRVPLTVEAARSRASASARATLLPLVTPTVPKLFPALVRMMSLAGPAARVVVPAAVTAPV